MMKNEIIIAFRIGTHQQDRIISTAGILPTILAGSHLNAQWMNLILVYDNMAKKYRIRKLTPTECFRLLGVRDKEIQTLCNSNISNSQLYKLAGNSIVVDVLMGIFKQMFEPTETKELTLF